MLQKIEHFTEPVEVNCIINDDLNLGSESCYYESEDVKDESFKEQRSNIFENIKNIHNKCITDSFDSDDEKKNKIKKIYDLLIENYKYMDSLIQENEELKKKRDNIKNEVYTSNDKIAQGQIKQNLSNNDRLINTEKNLNNLASKKKIFTISISILLTVQILLLIFF